MKKQALFFFTGAGISAESGLQTFRDSIDGLWNNYHIEDVCTPEGWERNPSQVLDFYNQRRKQCKEATPNKAHVLIADLEKYFDVTVVTQNVDDLHERAGSTKVLHLHGQLGLARSTVDDTLLYPVENDILTGDYCEKNSQLRPHIVWFGEALDDEIINESIQLAMKSAVCVVIGTSLQVYPANLIPTFIPAKSKLIIIDPNEVEFEFERSIHFIRATAVEGMAILVDSLKKVAKS